MAENIFFCPQQCKLSSIGTQQHAIGLLVFANFKTDVDSPAHDSPLYYLPTLADVQYKK
jgi:hypothetical protein